MWSTGNDNVDLRTGKERLINRLYEVDHDILVTQDLVKQAGDLVEAQAPLYEELRNDCKRLSSLMQAQALIANQASEENDRLESRLSKFKKHVGLM
ncbi:hypothetical protein NL676_004557 [Syzygium grande]|nr:hypothetical protein NL676_004557 [Syzygium grande]